MVKVIIPLFKALRAGQALSAPGAWKVAQNWINLLSGLVALAWALGYPLPLMEEDIALLAGGIIALINIYLTSATTRKIGLPNHEKPVSPIARTESERVRESKLFRDAENQNDRWDNGHNG